jgi:hypothetical protein
MAEQLGGMTTEALQAELKRRERHLKQLHKKREKLLTQLQEVDAQIVAEGGSVTGGVTRKRFRNDSNLADALVDLLKTQTLTVTEATSKVQEAGYRTTAANFRTIVNQTLIRDKRFKRVSRGKYTSGAAGGSKTNHKKKKTKRAAR